MDAATAETRHLFVRTVDDLRARLDSQDAYEVARCRRLHLESFVRTLAVELGTEPIEPALL